MIILVDMDGVLVDFRKGFLKVLNNKYPKVKYDKKKLAENFSVYDAFGKKDLKKIKKLIQEKNFYRNLPPIKKSILETKRLSKENEVFICSAPLSNSKYCLQEKMFWIEKYLGKDWLPKAIFTKDKTMIIGNILIDDKKDIKGVIKKPSWRHVLFEAIHNKKDFNKSVLKKEWSNKEILFD